MNWNWVSATFECQGTKELETSLEMSAPNFGPRDVSARIRDEGIHWLNHCELSHQRNPSAAPSDSHTTTVYPVVSSLYLYLFLSTPLPLSRCSAGLPARARFRSFADLWNTSKRERVTRNANDYASYTLSPPNAWIVWAGNWWNRDSIACSYEIRLYRKQLFAFQSMQ